MDFTDNAVDGQTALEQRQHTLSHMVRMVARKVSHALFVFGSQGGLGKSRTIVRTLDDEGVTPVLVNSHVTPLALYAVMFQHRAEQVIFFDDVDSIFSSMPHLGLLRSALWGHPSDRDLREFPVAVRSAALLRVHEPLHFCGERDSQQKRRLQGGAQPVRHL